MAEAPPWDPPSPEFNRQNQSMFDFRGQFFCPDIPEKGQLFINSVAPFAYDAADVMDDNNYATVFKTFVITLSLQVTQVNTKMVSGLCHVLAKK